MKLECVSLSKYAANVDIYEYAKLDLFELIFVRIILNDKLKDKRLVDCLSDLEISEDLYYLYNNIYYKFIDNKVISEVDKEFRDILVKDIAINSLFKEALENNYFPKFTRSEHKDFTYDYYKEKFSVESTKNDSVNIFTFKIDNSKAAINKLVNDHKKELLGINDGVCIVNNYIADPYYFTVELKEMDGKYLNSNELFNNSIKDNLYLVSKDDVVKGDILTNNMCFKCLYGDLKYKDLTDYLFIYSKDRAYEVDGSVIYVDYDFEDKLVDLVSKETYHLGYYYLNEEIATTFYTSKNNKVSEFKLYLIKNKERFKENIEKIIEMF